MIHLNIHSQQGVETIQGAPGESLLEILRSNGISMYAPCGGGGVCGKCRVRILGKGSVLSCICYPEKDMDISLPESTEAQILVSQTEYLEDYELEYDLSSVPVDHPVGMAIDIGTTTIVLYFVNMTTGHIEKISSFLNPQNSFGGDIIARINYCQENPDGIAKQQQIVIDAINKEMDVFKQTEGLTDENFFRIAITGNTTMLHLLLGVDPKSIALAPFIPKFTDKQLKRGEETDFHIHDKADLITLPCISAYVGADIVAGLAVLKSPYKNYLFLDIGTNGEMALVSGDNIYTCATAAGPAFEGANLVCGMGAVQGAISVFESPVEYGVIGRIPPVGICGSGIVDIIAYLIENRIVDEAGSLPEDFLIHQKNNIYISQQDIREIQLAKSAIYSGIKILLKQAGLEFDSVEALFLAGGFGNYINTESAIKIGLLPVEMKGKIHSVGNSAGIGALQYLRSENFAEKTEIILARAEYIELSGDDDFTLEFAMNMNFTKLD